MPEGRRSRLNWIEIAIVAVIAGAGIWGYEYLSDTAEFHRVAKPIAALAIENVQYPRIADSGLNDPQRIQKFFDSEFCGTYCRGNGLEVMAFANNVQYLGRGPLANSNRVFRVDIFIYPTGASRKQPDAQYQHDDRLGSVSIWFNEDNSVNSVKYIRKMR